MAFLSLADAKAQVNITTTTYDAELGVFIDAACDMVEQRVGAVATRTVTGEFVDLQGRTIFNELTSAGTRNFVLRWRPVQSIQAVVSAILTGVTYSPSDFWIDTNTGIIRRNDGGTIFGPLRVDYTAGYVTAPSWAVMAAKLILQDLWRSQRGGSVSIPGQQTDETPAEGQFSYVMSTQAQAILAPHMNVAAIG